MPRRSVRRPYAQLLQSRSSRGRWVYRRWRVLNRTICGCNEIWHLFRSCCVPARQRSDRKVQQYKACHSGEEKPAHSFHGVGRLTQSPFSALPTLATNVIASMGTGASHQRHIPHIVISSPHRQISERERRLVLVQLTTDATLAKPAHTSDGSAVLVRQRSGVNHVILQ